jgi:hypothetical protein
MKKSIIALLLFIVTLVVAQDLPLMVFPNATVKQIVENENTLLISGEFSNNLSIGSYSFNSAGENDAFVAKYVNSEVMWAVHLSSTNNISNAKLIIDNNENILFTGGYSEVMTFEHTAGNENIPYTERLEGYLIKVNTDGEYLWSATLRAGSNEYINEVITDEFDNIYISGCFNGCCPSYGSATLYFSNGASYTLNTPSYTSGFVVKISSAGTPLWDVTGWNRDFYISSMTIFNNSDLYIEGDFRSWSGGIAATITSPSFIQKKAKSTEFTAKSLKNKYR